MNNEGQGEGKLRKNCKFTRSFFAQAAKKINNYLLGMTVG